MNRKLGSIVMTALSVRRSTRYIRREEKRVRAHVGKRNVVCSKKPKRVVTLQPTKTLAGAATGRTYRVTVRGTVCRGNTYECSEADLRDSTKGRTNETE